MLIIRRSWNGAVETATDRTWSTNLETELLAYITMKIINHCPKNNEDHQDTTSH